MIKKNSFEKGALLLVITNLIAKVLGAVYRIPLTNMLKVEGMGMYQIVMPTLLLVLALTSNFIPISMSKSAAYLSSTVESKRIFNASMKFIILMCVFACSLLFILAKPIAMSQKNEDLRLCYILLIPTLILSGIKSVYRGWFLGEKNTFHPSICQLLEQIVKVGASLILVFFAMKKNLYFGVLAAIFSLVLGEIVGLLYLLIVKLIKQDKVEVGDYDKTLYYKLIVSQSMPVLLSGLIFPVISFVDSFLIVNLLTLFGANSKDAISLYGLLQGPVYSLINLPIMIAISFSLAIIPLLSTLLSNMEVKDIKQKSSLSLKLCFCMVMPGALGMIVIAKPLFIALYPALNMSEIDICVKLLIYSSVNIISLSMLEIFNSILQGLNRSLFATKSLIVGALSKIIVELIAVKFLSISGVVVSNIVFYSISLLISSIKYLRLVGFDSMLIQNIGKDIFASGIMALVVYYSSFAIENLIIKISVAIIVGIIIYIIVVLFLRIFTKQELESIFGKKITTKIFKY